MPKSEQQTLWSVPECSTARQVPECNERFDLCERVGEDGEAVEICDLGKVTGEDRVGKDDESVELLVLDEGGYGDKMGEGSDSSELCGWDDDLPHDSWDSFMEGYDNTLDTSDWGMEEYCSISSSDSEMEECVDSEKQSDSENDDSEQFEEDESFHEETKETEGSEHTNGSYKLMKKGNGPEAPDLTTGLVGNDYFLGYRTIEDKIEATQIARGPSGKLPLPMAASFIKRNYVNYERLHIKRGVVQDWACVNFSSMYAPVYLFFDKLVFVCDIKRMHFNCCPMKTFHVKSAIPNNIVRTLRGVRKSIMELFSKIDMEGEPIGLLLVILPESRDFDAKIVEACQNLGVVYQCCLPCDIYKPTKRYMQGTTREIKSKVVERDTFIPFVSEGPTIILGADTSCDTVASVVTSVGWQEFEDYRAVVEPNNGVIIQQLFNEHGGMIGNLLGPVRGKIKRVCRIIFFRHVINEDHIMHICRQEVVAIKQACAHLKIGSEPLITFVVVGGNGIQEDSCNYDKLDFVCHHGYIEGTSPARYRVIHDENNLTLLDLDSIIIKLCLLDRTFMDVSMVPPAYSAWLAASQTEEGRSCDDKTATPSSSDLPL